MIPCMGGNCSSRGRCAHYYSESTFEIVERLCGQREEPEEMESGRKIRDAFGAVANQQSVSGWLHVVPGVE